jgi:multiple sugar transport system substrate-binding protein
MDDNNKNQQENQPTPIYETVPEETEGPHGTEFQPLAPEPMQPEEIPAEVVNPQEAFVGQAPADEIPPDEPPPIYDEQSKTKYFIIGGGVLFFILIFVFILSLLLGGGKKKPTNVKLTYWILWEDASAFDPLVKAYEKENPNVQIDVQKMSPEDYREKLSARIPQGKGPDIFRYHNTWLPEIRDIVAPLPEEVMTKADFEKTFYPIHTKDLCLQADSSPCDPDIKKRSQYFYYGIPLEIDGLVMIYNDQLFKQANVDKPPATLDELVDQAFLSKFTFKDNDGKLVSSAIAMGTATNVEHFSDIFGLLLLQNGGNLKTLDDSAGQGALEGYRKFAEPDIGIWDDSMPNSIAAFVQGKVAMIIAPSYEILSIKAQNPDIKLKVAPIPFNLPGSPSISLADYWAEGVSIKSQNSVEAWKFLKYLSEKENLTKLYAEESKTRLFGEPYSRVDLANQLLSNEYLGVVIQQADHYYSLPVITRTYDKGLNDGIVSYIQNAINDSAKGVSYQAALSPAKEGINKIFQQYKIQ